MPDHADQRFPAGRAKGQRRFAQRAGNREQRVLSHGTDGRHAHERQHERGVQQVEPGIRSEPVLKERGDDDHAEKADDNRRQRRQQFDERLDDAPRPAGRDLRQIGRRHDAERHRDARRQNGYRQRAHNQREDAEFGRLGRGVP